MIRKIIIFSFGLFLMCSSLHAQISLGDASNNSNSILAMQQISVTIGGEFIVNGSFPASSNERIDQFVTRIYNQNRLALLTTSKDQRSFNELRTEIDEFALRGIILKHRNGQNEIIDLYAYRLTADYSENPYLSNDDVIIFPPLDWERNFIEVEGAVNKPIQFQFIEGDRLSDALLFSRGINNAFNDAHIIEITRLSYDGMSEEIFNFGIEDNPILERGDRIRVVGDETQKRDFKVLVLGEVNKPGYIYISLDQTTIKEVIQKAGGFKENADLRNSELIRNYINLNTSGGTNIKFQDRKRSFSLRNLNSQTDLLMMNRMADILTEDSLSLINDNQLRNAKSIVTVDFDQVLDEKSDNSKFIVKDGDIISIPEITNLVYVFGQVMNPGYIDFEENQNYSYYIEKTGGIGNRAKDEVFLIKGKSRAWIDMTDEENEFIIESGDYIWVPKDIPRDYDYYLGRTSQIAGIIGSVATVVLLLTQIGK